jgi:hypothetical protein
MAPSSPETPAKHTQGPGKVDYHFMIVRRDGPGHAGDSQPMTLSGQDWR